MYKTILVTLDATEADQTILEHIVPLAKLCGGKLVLLHVADGWAARTYGDDAVSPEITEDRAYLAKIQGQLQAQGLEVESELAFGEPAREIIAWVERRHCDLIAMTTHGHRFLSDLIRGTTATTVRHHVDIPVLLLKAR